MLLRPQLLVKLALGKLENKQIYKKLETDPTHDLQKELFDLWVYGKTEDLISPKFAKDIMGISDNQKVDGSGPTNRPSTLPVYKPGTPYFYPSLKIHKLKRADLVPGVRKTNFYFTAFTIK